MYAIVEIAGKQFRVEKDQKIKVPHLQTDAGKKVEFDRVLYYTDDKGKVEIGKPTLKNMKVKATVVEHGRDKKIIVFKKKRRKGYQVKNGHRQGFSVIQIDGIGVVKAAKKTEPKAKPEKKAAPKKAKAAAPAKSPKKTTAKPKKEQPAEGKEA